MKIPTQVTETIKTKIENEEVVTSEDFEEVFETKCIT